MTKDEKQEIAEMVVSMLKQEKSEQKIADEWLKLRKDIELYCREEEDQYRTCVRFTTLIAKIYDSIRAVLNIQRIEEIRNEDVPEARKVFEFIKSERERTIEAKNEGSY